MLISKEELTALPKTQRLNLVNTLAGYKQPNLIVTKGNDAIENVAIFSSVIHLGSNPALLGFITRPNTVPRNTYQNILENPYYTINMVSHTMIEDAHQTSGKYAKEISEFDKTNLTPIYLGNYPVPYVGESPIKIGLKLVEKHLIQANNTILIVGEIMEIHLPIDSLPKDGQLALDALEITAIGGLNRYYQTSFSKERPYVRV